MKSFQLVIFVLLTALSATAQETNSFYFVQYNHYQYTEKSYVGSALVEEQKNGFPIGLQMVKNRTAVRAIRLGVTVTENQLATPLVQTIDNVTTSSYKTHKLFTPTLTVGHEWQYIPLPSLMFYSGTDAGLGFMKNSLVSNETKESHASYASRSVVNGYAYSFNASIKPFLGFRFSVYRLIVGYEIAMPFRYTHVFNGPSEFANGRLSQHVYIGYTNLLYGFKEGSCHQRFN